MNSLTTNPSVRFLDRALVDLGHACRSGVRRLRRRFGRRTPSSVDAITQWLTAIGHPAPARGRILIVAVRNHTWIEWAAYCACVIRTLGFESTIAYFGDEVERLYPSGSEDSDFWHLVSRIPGVELIDLNQTPVSGQDVDRWRAEASDWSTVAVAYDEHLEELDIVEQPERYQERCLTTANRAATGGAALHKLAGEGRFTRALCPSGLIGETKVLLSALRASQLETICVEGWAWRPGHLIYNLNAPALEYNVEGWMRSFGPWDVEQEDAVDQYLKFLDGSGKRAGGWLANFYRIQRAGIDAPLPSGLRAFIDGSSPVFLMVPNVVGDSSTLRRETIFPSQQMWVRRVIEWFAARPQLKLIVRAHPAERWIGGKCRIRMGDIARQAAAGVANVYVVGSDDKLNTFSLLPYTRAGLTWMSSAGAECVVRGRPAVVAARPKYTALGIVQEPTSVEDYFSAIEQHATLASTPSQEQIRKGKQYLHMVFRGFSFEATGRTFRAASCRLGEMPSQAEHDRFYRILVGDEPMPEIGPHETVRQGRPSA